MTVSQMEEITGLTRANIRFYETQGLIAPARQENRYREYTDEHAQVLLRIKLLRALGMSLEQIKALQSGEENMIAALDRQIQEIEAQQIQLGNSNRVCREMRADGVEFHTLNAAHYLSSLKSPPNPPARIMEVDVTPPVFAPWQRFFARTFDTFFYTMLLLALSAWLMDGKISPWSGTVSTILGFAMTLVFEPVQLRLFGTTLGKWIFGIRVTDNEGDKLSLSDGFWRTLGVIFYGEGLGIGLINFWRYWRSYKMYSNREYLPWEDRSEIVVKDTNGLRYLAAIGAAVAVFYGSVGLIALAQMPDNRGQLTQAAFCENYRKLAAQEGWYDERYTLRDDGTWVENLTNTIYIDMSANPRPLNMTITTENGIVTSVTISEKIEGSVEGRIGTRTSERKFMALAMLMAQEDYSVFRGDEEAILQRIGGGLVPFEHTQNGLRFTYDVEFTGYWDSSIGLIEDDDPNTASNYAMTFRVEVIE